MFPKLRTLTTQLYKNKLQKLFSYNNNNNNNNNRPIKLLLSQRLLSTNINGELMNAIYSDANKARRQVSFQELLQYSQAQSNKMDQDIIKIQSAEWTRQQLPPRLARIVVDLQNLPYGLINMPSVKEVHQLYIDTYQAIAAINPVKTIQDETEFANNVRGRLKQHLLVIPKLCVGILEMADKNPSFRVEETMFLNDFIDQIARERLSVRVLLGHYVALHDTKMGIFDENLDVLKPLNKAVADANATCDKYFGKSPKVNIHDSRKIQHSFCSIPEHLHHMSFELLKNSMRAVCETHKSDKLPDIDIVIASSKIDVTIKIVDQGGGIARNEMDRVWLYSYSTAVDPQGRSRKELLLDVMDQAQYQDAREVLGAIKNVPMYGLGYGLPICRLYSRFYGGDCQLFSMHGYGTDAYLWLPNLKKTQASVIW